MHLDCTVLTPLDSSVRNRVRVGADRQGGREGAGGLREAVGARLRVREETPPGRQGGQDHHDRGQVGTVEIA